MEMFFSSLIRSHKYVKSIQQQLSYEQTNIGHRQSLAKVSANCSVRIAWKTMNY